MIRGTSEPIPYRQIRAVYDADTITVYQAYAPAIAEAAVRAGTFAPPFSMTRMTWIKPSFLWMMYRCGWAAKEGQERVLALRLSRSGFESALNQACLSHFDPEVHADEATWRAQVSASPVRIQWDPERTPKGEPLHHRSLQVGLGVPVVAQFVNEWIQSIDDITASLPLLRNGRMAMPDERPYPLPAALAERIAASPAS